MDAHRGDFKFRIQGARVQTFDVLHMMFNGVPRDPHIAPGEAIEHKGVVPDPDYGQTSIPLRSRMSPVPCLALRFLDLGR